MFRNFKLYAIKNRVSNDECSGLSQGSEGNWSCLNQSIGDKKRNAVILKNLIEKENLLRG